MQKTKKVLVLAMAALMIFALCACGGNPVVGKWKLSEEAISASFSDTDTAADATDALDDIFEAERARMIEAFENITLEFTKDNKIIMRIEGAEEIHGEYSVEGDTITMTIGGESQPVTLDGDTMSADGIVVFVRA